MLLTITESEDGIKIISLQGRMDIIGSQDIDTRFTVAIASETANVVIDLSGVDFMSSIGIGVMVRAANALLKRNGKIVFMNPRPNVLQVLESTMITKVVPVFWDMDSARNYLKS